MVQMVHRLASIYETVKAAEAILERREKDLRQRIEGVDVSVDAKASLAQFDSLLSSTCEFIHARASQLLLVRKTAYMSLRLGELRDVFDVTNTFIVDSEKMCKKTFYGLRGTLLSQAKRFLEQFHTKNMNQLNACLEAELWKQVDVPREFQNLIDSGFKRKIHAVNHDGSERKVSRVLFFAVHGENGAHSGFLKFGLVGSTMILLKMISRYIDCAAQLKAVGSDVLNKLISLLQIFNSKSCQLVLGAAAIQTAGLKNINVTHLALASQSLGLVMSQVPVIRSALAQHLPTKHHVLLDNFASVNGDYKEHQQEIFKKLVQIIRQLVEAAMSSLTNSAWAKGQEQPKVKVERSIKLLMRQTASMHNKLSNLLDQSQRDNIFKRIAEVYQTQTKKYLTNLYANGKPLVKQKISAQVQHVLTRLRGLTGIDKSACWELEAFVSKEATT